MPSDEEWEDCTKHKEAGMSIWGNGRIGDGTGRRR